MSRPLPRTFDGYQLERLLGKGGMGEVYVAHDALLDRSVAIKLIASGGDRRARERFIVEARAVARLQHPNVVSVYRVGETEGMPYLVSELVRGTPLDRLERPVAPALALDIALGLASGLAAAHVRGVLHRDIKPANAILSDDGTVKLLDFGIAKLLEPLPASEPAPPEPRPAPLEDTEATRPALAEESTRCERAAAPSTAAATLTRTREERSVEPTRATRATPTARDEVPMGLTKTGVALGTPRYMAPEIWRGEPSTFQSDVYSFGALLFTLVAGKPPHPAKTLDELRAHVLEHDPVPLASVAPAAEPGLAAIVDRCLARDPAARFASGSELRAAISKLLPGARTDLIPDGNPYRGLASFEAEHRDLFFGRESETRMLLDRLAADGFVVVAGDSGVGKSSLCRAGVLTRVSHWLDQGRPWRVVTVVPGRHPVTAVSAALTAVMGVDEDTLARKVREDPGGLARELRGLDTGVVVFVDQLEELVTLSVREEAAAVAELFGWLAVPAPGARLLAAARGDFLSRLATLPRIGDAITRGLFFLRPLSEERVREAIVGPARAKGGAFESPALVDELVASARDAGDGALPLLQFTLAELWEARGPDDVISHATLDALGGVSGALTRHADRVMHQMLPAEREASRRVLSRLVTSEGTRARRRDVELGVEDVNVAGGLAALVRGRLLVARDEGAGTSYEIAHEALLEGWDSLARWLSEDAGARRVLERLRVAVDEWERLGRRRDGLWSARQLREMSRLDETALAPRERTFVTASRRAARRRVALRLLGLAAAPLLALVLWATFELRAAGERDAAVAVEVEAATLAFHAATRVDRDARDVRRRALARFDGGEEVEAERLWSHYRGLLAELRPHQEEATERLERALRIDPTRSDLRGRLADVLYARALLAEAEHQLEQRDELIGRLEIHDDTGERRARWSAPGRLRLTTLPTARIELARHSLDDAGRLGLEPVLELVGEVDKELPPGSYLVAVAAPGRAPVRHTFVIQRGETLSVRLEPPPVDAIPEGFVLVPPGRFAFGSAADEVQRRDFFHAPPLHEVESAGFLIGRFETTFGEWVEFLEALPAATRSAHLPRVDKGGFKGGLALEETEAGWRLTFQPTTVTHVALEGEPIRYEARSRAVVHDWRRVPVVGITAADAEAYAAWLHASGRVTGARLCSELEWEHAARGADGRPYPHGLSLLPDDANHDATYGQEPPAMGPNEVGSHPLSVSPYGVHDMAGNVWEWTRSAFGAGHAARGGSFYFGVSSSRADDREQTEASFRDTSVGMRLCADLPASTLSVR